MKELHLRMPAALLVRLDTQRKKDGITTDRSDFIRRVVEKEITRLENRAVRDLVMKPQLRNSATEPSAARPTAQLSYSATGTEGN